jgi:SPP1 gp7 family putative phage head morphogenesis protein
MLQTFGPAAATSIQQALVGGIASGQGPAVIARTIRADLGGNLTRALTVSRTEILRSFNSAALSTYRANSDVVRGWVWLASLSSRTCGFCISMNGTFHELSEAFASHPRCRCSPVPQTKTFAELGLSSSIPETQVQVQSGSDWFAQQDDATQLAILGPSKLRAYQAGAIQLSDLRGFRDDPRWGPTGFEKSLTSILGADAQQYLRPAATG